MSGRKDVSDHAKSPAKAGATAGGSRRAQLIQQQQERERADRNSSSEHCKGCRGRKIDR